MVQKFQNHLKSNFPFLENKNLLLATSGGIDSMVMVDLFQKLGYNFGMLHCNFKLRGAESDADMKFVTDFGNKHLIPWSVGHFDTKEYAEEYHVSIQVAARELRYEWFEEQRIEKDFDFVLTAHHSDDNLETFLINFSRGSGLDGLVGIPKQNMNIIRPMLAFSRQEIEEYAVENKLKWREDSSNSSNKYLRNKIRHHIVPQLKELNENYLNSFQKTQLHLQEAQSLVDDAAKMMYLSISHEKVNQIHFDLIKLKILPNYRAYLYQWLKEYEFSSWDDIYDLVEAQSGKIVYAPQFQLLKNRNHLILSEKVKSSNESFSIDKLPFESHFPIQISIQNVNEVTETNKNCIFVDQDKLVFPLIVRRWGEGDFFQPIGMNGNSKKVSKFFKDEKMSILEKHNTWILTSNNQIVWILGKRQDERFKIQKTTINIIQIIFQ